MPIKKVVRVVRPSRICVNTKSEEDFRSLLEQAEQEVVDLMSYTLEYP